MCLRQSIIRRNRKIEPIKTTKNLAYLMSKTKQMIEKKIERKLIIMAIL